MKNPSNLDSSQLSVSGNQLIYRGSVYYLRGTNAYAARPYHWSFNETNSTYGNGNDTNLPLSMKFSTNAKTVRFVKEYYDNASPAGFSNAFNCIRNPVSPLIFDANLANAAGISEAERVIEWHRLNSYADQCALEGIWLMVCPYGMGLFGDYPERRVNATVAAEVKSGDRDAQNHVAVTTAVTSTLRSIRKWMKQRADSGLAIGHILINTLNEPREFEAGDDQKWFDMQSAWISALRTNVDGTQHPYDGPIFVDGHHWANRLFVPKARSLAVQDANLVFLSHRYANQPSTTPIYGNAKEWPDFKEAATGINPSTGQQTSTTKLCVGVGEMGPSHEGVHLQSGVEQGDEFVDSAAMQNFVDEYVEDLFIDSQNPIPVFLLWMVLHDPSSMFGYQNTSGVSPVLEDLYPDYYGANPNEENPNAFIYDDQFNGVPKLNKWAEISKHAFAKSLQVSGGSPSPVGFTAIPLDLSGHWNDFNTLVGVSYDSVAGRMLIDASGDGVLHKGAKKFLIPVSANKVYKLGIVSDTNTGRVEIYPGGSVQVYETDVDGNELSSPAINVLVNAADSNNEIYFRVTGNQSSFFLQVQSDNAATLDTLLLPMVSERTGFVATSLPPFAALTRNNRLLPQLARLSSPEASSYPGGVMRLSDNFHLSEFERSEYADLHGLDNSIPYKYIDNIQRLVDEILQPLRDHLNLPIVISSGYRSKAVNAGVNGAKNSAHLYGLAADIYSPSVTAFDMTETIIRSGLPFEKVIHEFGKWTHVRVAKQGKPPARKVFTAYKSKKGKTKYVAGNWPVHDSRLA